MPREIEGQDVWCPKCRRLMVPLSSYEPTPLDTMPGVDMPDFHDFAMGIADEKLGLSLVLNLIGYLRFRFKQWRVGKLKRKWLAKFPQTLVCPLCLTVFPRRGKGR
ncbi:MAG: hypothetical protein ACK40X_04535 [Armatimonadota bacterium]